MCLCLFDGSGTDWRLQNTIDVLSIRTGTFYRTGYLEPLPPLLMEQLLLSPRMKCSEMAFSSESPDQITASVPPMVVAASIIGDRRALCFLAFHFSVIFLQIPFGIMALTTRSAYSRSQARNQMRHLLQDARSGFSRRPHEALSAPGENVLQQLSVEEFQLGLQNQLILAPLTRGGNLPFRRLCADFNSNFTMSEMAYARNLFKGYHKAQKKERALAKKGPTERYFGFQIATKSSDEALRAAELAVKEGATWIDLNCGCPIYEATRRGLGAAMLKRPSSLEKLVGLTVASTPLPMTVKIRLGVSDTKINAHQVVEGLVNAGVAAVTVHGRTMEQRYTRPADWKIISDIAKSAGVPIIGNGDILTWYEAEDRMQDSNNGVNSIDSSGKRSGVTALMAGRGALIKPWIFKEWADKKTWFPTPEERIAVYWQLSLYFKEHFGSDEHGKRHSFYFLPWHFEFFCRYRPLPDDPFRELSRQVPLIQNSRSIDDKLIAIGLLSDRNEPIEARNKLLDSPLERLLRCELAECHLAISEVLWASETAEEAVDALLLMAHSRIIEFELLQQQGSSSSQSVRGRGVLRNNEEDRSGRADESSWVAGGSGPRGARVAPVGEIIGGDDDDDLNSTGEEDSIIDDNGKIPRTPVRDRLAPLNPIPWSRNGMGLSPSEISIPFLELRVAKFVSVLPHPDPTAENLVVTTVDLGPDKGGLRTAVTAQRLIAGEETGMRSLIGKSVIALCNLKSRTFLGVESSAMLLFSTNENNEFCPLYAPNDAPIGTIVSFPGYSSKPSDSPSRAAKAWRQLEKEGSFYVNKEGVACFDPRPNTKSGKSIGADKDESEEDMLDGKSLVDSDNSVLGKREKGRSVPFSVYLNDFSVEGTRSKGLICTSAVSGRIL